MPNKPTKIGCRIASFFLLLCLTVLHGCGGTRADTRELLGQFCEEYAMLPDGKIYASEAQAWEGEAVPSELPDLLFLEGNGENALSLCREYAIYLATSYTGGEIGIFRCDNSADALRVTEMCTARLARLFHLQADSPLCKDACVLRYGNDIVLLFLPDNAAARTLCDRIF